MSGNSHVPTPEEPEEIPLPESSDYGGDSDSSISFTFHDVNFTILGDGPEVSGRSDDDESEYSDGSIEDIYSRFPPLTSSDDIYADSEGNSLPRETENEDTIDPRSMDELEVATERMIEMMESSSWFDRRVCFPNEENLSEFPDVLREHYRYQIQLEFISVHGERHALHFIMTIVAAIPIILCMFPQTAITEQRRVLHDHFLSMLRLIRDETFLAHGEVPFGSRLIEAARVLGQRLQVFLNYPLMIPYSFRSILHTIMVALRYDGTYSVRLHHLFPDHNSILAYSTALREESAFSDSSQDEIQAKGPASDPIHENEMGTNTEIFNLAQRQTDEATMCLWCLEPVPSGVSATFLPCNHWFHTDCIEPWLRYNARCPSCRGAISLRVHQNQYRNESISQQISAAGTAFYMRREERQIRFAERLSAAKLPQERDLVHAEEEYQELNDNEAYESDLQAIRTPEDFEIPEWPLLNALVTRGTPIRPSSIITMADPECARKYLESDESEAFIQRSVDSLPARPRPEWDGNKRAREESTESDDPNKVAKTKNKSPGSASPGPEASSSNNEARDTSSSGLAARLQESVRRLRDSASRTLHQSVQRFRVRPRRHRRRR